MHSTDLIHKNIRISGRVQGVGFRYAARNMASLLGIQGTVRNLSNGDVYIEAEGVRVQMDEFIAWCREGPPRARVVKVEVVEGDMEGYAEFSLKY
jgi:acylphosphatase